MRFSAVWKGLRCQLLITINLSTADIKFSMLLEKWMVTGFSSGISHIFNLSTNHLSKCYTCKCMHAYTGSNLDSVNAINWSIFQWLITSLGETHVKSLICNKIASFGMDDPEFTKKWENILNKCSLDLDVLIIEKKKRRKRKNKNQ